MVYLNKAQRKTLHQKYVQTLQATSAPQHTYREFRKLVQPGWGYVTIPFAGGTLGIEEDGYPHM